MYILLTSMDCNEAILLDSAFFITIEVRVEVPASWGVYFRLLSLQYSSQRLTIQHGGRIPLNITRSFAFRIDVARKISRD